jgi:hypothetical protein
MPVAVGRSRRKQLDGILSERFELFLAPQTTSATTSEAELACTAGQVRARKKWPASGPHKEAREGGKSGKAMQGAIPHGGTL